MSEQYTMTTLPERLQKLIAILRDIAAGRKNTMGDYWHTPTYVAEAADRLEAATALQSPALSGEGDIAAQASAWLTTQPAASPGVEEREFSDAEIDRAIEAYDAEPQDYQHESDFRIYRRDAMRAAIAALRTPAASSVSLSEGGCL